MEAVGIRSGLNAQQERAVTFGDGALLVVAGAGSGKTRVLTRRVAHLLDERGLAPEEVLAFTFTNRAAREMRERLVQLVGERARRLWVGTFHGTCLRLLRVEAPRLGYPDRFTVFDRDDQLALVSRLLKQIEIPSRELPPGQLLSRISGAKNALVSPEQYEAAAVVPIERQAARVYRLYQEELRRQAAMDFDDLIAYSVSLLEDDAETRARWAGRFRHVLVDEYQDTNHAQFRLVAALASGHGNVAAVGDEDQSIYGWRGADLSNVLDFERRFPGAEVIRLEQNYRSTPIILEAASAVIANNRLRRGKTLWTERGGGTAIRVLLCGDEQAEGLRLAEEVLRRTARGLAARDCAVLYRTNAQSRALELAFRQRGVPYELVGGLSFYERREVKDLLCYLRLAYNPRDRESFLRIANTPRRGLGAQALARLSQLMQDGAATPAEALRRWLDESRPTRPARRGAEGLLALLEHLASARDDGPDLLLERVLADTHYLDYLEESSPQDAAERRDNVEELVAAARQFTAEHGEAALEGFLGEAALVADVDRWSEDEDRAVLMTAHNAKGLEFPVVMLAGCEEGFFPHASALADEAELEEERRLFYVVLTRAQEEVIVSAAAFRRRYDGRGAGELSRFVREIPPHLLVQEHPPGWARHATTMPRRAPAAAPVDDENVGRTVYHESFGKGTIVGAEGEGAGRKFTVRFAGVGVKKVLGRFLIPDE